jgi:GNAT superfamily N-acetyltransferase
VQKVTLEPALPTEVGEVLAVLDEAAAWLRRTGVVDQWPARFRTGMVEPAIERGETWLARRDGVVAGTITLDWDDPLWRDRDGVAGYVHRIAVRRNASGLGALLLDWAVQTSRAWGCEFLRLDCAVTSRRLRSYYEARGFRHLDDVPVGKRTEDGPTVFMSRYELPL